ncbi:MAG: hypothetical protein DRO18_04460, partial [Thermoprotei archaeon]
MRGPQGDKVAIEVDDLTVCFNDVCILKHVSFSIKEGETVLITGPSGSGKTTLLRSLIGIIPHLTEAYVDGKVSIYGYSPLSKRDVKPLTTLVTYVPQEPWDSIITPYVWTELAVLGVKSLNEVHNYLRGMGLSGYEHRLTYTLSAGEAQRLNALTAFVRGSKVFLFDEPISHLDMKNKIQVVEAIKIIKSRGGTSIIIDHDLEFWLGVVDRCFYIDNGILSEIPCIELLNKYERLKRDLSWALSKSLARNVLKGKKLCELNDVYFKYLGSDYVIKDLSVSVYEGEFLTLIGPSGSGKTTLLKLIAGLLRPTKGRVKCGCKRVLIPENPILFFTEPTIRDEVLKPGESLGYELLRRFNLVGKEDLGIVWLSSGEKRRAAIASAMVRGYKL